VKFIFHLVLSFCTGWVEKLMWQNCGPRR